MKGCALHKLSVANGSTDPVLGFDVGRNPPIDTYVGFSVSIPLRIFDRNQGEKRRTQLDIDRNDRLAAAARAQVFNDVDSAYATVNSAVILLKPYKDQYLEEASSVRDTISFSYQHGARFDSARAEPQGANQMAAPAESRTPSMHRAKRIAPREYGWKHGDSGYSAREQNLVQ